MTNRERARLAICNYPPMDALDFGTHEDVAWLAGRLDEAESRGRAEVQRELDEAVVLLERARDGLTTGTYLRIDIIAFLDARVAAKKGG